MEPSQRLATRGRSFYTQDGSRNIGRGLTLWRGYFQSIRPALGRMLTNVDISTGLMYKPGPLIDLCLEFLNSRNPMDLTRNLAPRARRDLKNFLSGIRVATKDARNPQFARARAVRNLSEVGANEYTFTMRGGGGTRTVAQYFQQTTGQRLKYPNLLCVQVCFPP
jgi:eukaryotic translation initiation factor 2C